MRALAPAKLNLCLFVGPVRPDGLHEICSLFIPLALADEVVLEPLGNDAAGGRADDQVVCPGVEGLNLAAAALAAFRERFGWKGPPVRLTIDKRIPVAGGLGGGSADAAATLRLIQAHAGLAPPAEELAGLAMELGADVPSQLDPRPLIVSGAGEELEPLDGDWSLSAVLLPADGRLDTARVYARADELRAPCPDLGAVHERLRAAAIAAAGHHRPVAGLGGMLQNDLQQAALDLEPAAGRALGLLHEAGAEAALLSGSGPTAFGLFTDPAEAERAGAAIAREWDGAMIVTGTAPPGHGDPRAA
jgi:4-diphosphocytidyl-2-C-methyl-D-erythritol kinase